MLDNPVSAFFQFCKDREEIRLKRESGIPAPWSDDEIFQKGRFLNVFREDDRGSKAIMNFSKNLNGDLIIRDMMSSDYEHAVKVFDSHFGDFVTLLR